MRDDLPHQPSAENPDPNQENWISKKEVLERYNVTDRQLEYWRDNGKIRYKIVKHLTYYIEKEIQEQEKLLAIPKKSLFIRKNKSGFTIRKIDPPIVILGIAACFLFMNDFSFLDPWQAWLFKNWMSIELIIIALGWYLIRLIKYIRKNSHEKGKLNNS